MACIIVRSGMDADRLLVGLGQRVRALRTERRSTLRDLAGRAGLSERFLVQVEAGRADISVRELPPPARAPRATPARPLPAARGAGDLAPVPLLGFCGAGTTTI